MVLANVAQRLKPRNEGLENNVTFLVRIVSFAVASFSDVTYGRDYPKPYFFIGNCDSLSV